MGAKRILAVRGAVKTDERHSCGKNVLHIFSFGGYEWQQPIEHKNVIARFFLVGNGQTTKDEVVILLVQSSAPCS